MSSCELSAQGHAFSTVLTAFVGSVLNGLFNGAIIAFFTAWICWLSPIRVIVSGIYEYYLAYKSGTDFASVERGQYETIEMNSNPNEPENGHSKAHIIPGATAGMPVQIGIRTSKAQWRRMQLRSVKREVTVFGWLGWIWSAFYTPISQSIWVAANVDTNDGAILLVRSVAIGVSALSLTFDTKQRYGASLGRKWGSWAFVAFNLWNATACLLLGGEQVAILVIGAMNVDIAKDFPAVFAIYPIFCMVWAAASFWVLPVMDGSRKGIHIVVDVLIGAFGGAFVAAPAFILLSNANFQVTKDQMFGEAPEPGLSLGDYLNCQGASVLDKFAAVMP